MSNRLGELIKELEDLSPDALDAVAEMVERWKEPEPERRYHLLERTAGALTNDEAGQLEAAIQECRRIDTLQG